MASNLNQGAHRSNTLLEQLVDTLLNLIVLLSTGNQTQAASQCGWCDEYPGCFLKNFCQGLLTKDSVA